MIKTLTADENCPTLVKWKQKNKYKLINRKEITAQPLTLLIARTRTKKTILACDTLFLWLKVAAAVKGLP